MSKILIGDACAHMVGGGGKARYLRVGSAFKDEKFGSISIKLDSLPIAGAGVQQWSGWINIFDQRKVIEGRSHDDSYSEEDVPF